MFSSISGCQRIGELQTLVLDITSHAMATALGKLRVPTLRTLELTRNSSG